MLFRSVSRIEIGNLPFKKEYFSINEITEKIINRSKPVANASNINIEFYPIKSLPKAWSDSSQIKSAIGNLLDNAIRYTPAIPKKARGEIEINIKQKNKHILFEIKDNGVGIPKKDQKYIFQKFFRSENALRYQTHGSGLGLYIAKSIIEKSKGKIWFKSKENIGTTFWFTLPIK